ncbi:hypothetical protein NIES3974_21960 [Calothrix sp. NIES-3974]|nr:hypothetical protein NIES3974_21960 [Calothrix sp. NIES-3974]
MSLIFMGKERLVVTNYELCSLLPAWRVLRTRSVAAGYYVDAKRLAVGYYELQTTNYHQK